MQKMKLNDNSETQGKKDRKESEKKQEQTPTAPLWPAKPPSYNFIKNPNAIPINWNKRRGVWGTAAGRIYTVTWRPKSVKNKNKSGKSKIKQKTQDKESDKSVSSEREAKTDSAVLTDTCSSSDNDALESEDEQERLLCQEAVKRWSHKQGAVGDNISHSLNKRDCEPKAAEKKRMTCQGNCPATQQQMMRPVGGAAKKKKTCQRLHLSEGDEEEERQPLKKPKSARNLVEHFQAMRIQLEGTLTPQKSNNDEKKLKEAKERTIKSLEDSKHRLQESNELWHQLWEDAEASRRLSWSMHPLDEEPTLQRNQESHWRMGKELENFIKMMKP